jgi:tetratricopeptide (TPR) repeat protein
MKSLKRSLIVAATVILLVVFGLLFMSNNNKKHNSRQNLTDSDTASPRTQQDTAVADTILPQPKQPVLKINGTEDPDVYLQSLDIQVEVTGNIASTRHTMIFKNKTNRDMEGELTFPLPDERSVTYYALDINGQMREAVPVDKARATQVFEEIEQRRVDPGLLERVEGNNFRTRVYPIPANGTRTISIGYEEELTLEKDLLQYRLPMTYPNPFEKFAVTATVWKSGVKPLVSDSVNELRFDKSGENYVASFSRRNYRPARTLNFSLPIPVDVPQIMIQPARDGYYFLASITPTLETRKKQWGNVLAIIWDVSLSASQRDLKRELEMLNIIFAEKKNANVHLYFLNNKLQKIINKNSANGEYVVTNGNWNALKSVLETTAFDGGTDFSQINLNDITGNEILFFSDGISTLSDADFIKDTTVNRPIHCVVSSERTDYSAMRLIAGKTMGKFVNANALSSDELKNELLNETLQFLGTEHENTVREVYPSIATPIHGSFSLSGISNVNVAELTLLFGFGNTVEKRINIILDAKKTVRQGNTHKIWAQKKIAELDLNYEKNRAELTELGKQFGIVTRNTSLIVLETLRDYIHFNIEPPAELQDEYRRYIKERGEQRRDTDTAHDMLKTAATVAGNLTDWRNNPRISGFGIFLKRVNRLYDSVVGDISKLVDDAANGLDLIFPIPKSREVSADFFEKLPEERTARLVRQGEFPSSSASQKNNSSPTITVKPIKSDNDYFNTLTGKNTEDYQLYLKTRTDYANSPTFYFDMADWFYKHGDKETALRVLTSIADLDLENASLYRLLGYRLKEYGEYALEKFICKKVILWRPMEPQSYRDYALALADNGEAQAALDSLYGLLTRLYSENIKNRSRGIEEVVITEINHLIAKNPNLNTSKIDTRLIIDIPVDIRVVINWNMNSTDIDLHVKDPIDEMCFFGNRKTIIGGRISIDNTNGYGPEQFLLKNAVKGKYRIYVNYYGDRQVTSAGPATVMAEIFTKYADKTEQRKVVCLQLSNAKKLARVNLEHETVVEIANFKF